MDRGPEATERRGGGQSPVASRLALLWTLRTGSWTGRGETQPSQQPRLRSVEAVGDDYLTDDEEADDVIGPSLVSRLSVTAPGLPTKDLFWTARISV